MQYISLVTGAITTGLAECYPDVYNTANITINDVMTFAPQVCSALCAGITIMDSYWCIF